MNTCIFAFLCLAAGLFLLKMAYAASVALTVSVTRGALYVSTSRRRINAALDELHLRRGQVIIDLGCGDGRVLRAARRRCSVRAVGYEINPAAFLKAKLCCAGRGIEIRRRDFRAEPIHMADVIFCYLFPDVMHDLLLKLRAEAKPAAVVVSFNFPLPETDPVKVLRPEGSFHKDPVYFYRMGGYDKLEP